MILLREEGDAFLSAYDSDNAALDTGELKDLALATSRIFKTAAVCTSLFDSDTFEVVGFNAGKQVDLVMTHPEQYGGPRGPWRRSPKPTIPFKIALKDGHGLDDLEFALLPVLPVESVRVHMR